MQTAEKTKGSLSEKKTGKSRPFEPKTMKKKKIAICMNFSLAFCAKVW